MVGYCNVYIVTLHYIYMYILFAKLYYYNVSVVRLIPLDPPKGETVSTLYLRDLRWVIHFLRDLRLVSSLNIVI